MPLYRTPVVDGAQPLIFVPGVQGYSTLNAGCATPYFQRVLLKIARGADTGAAVGGGVTGWSEPSGAFGRGGIASFAPITISNPPTQAEVQAIQASHAAWSQHMAALISDLLVASILKP